MIVVQGRQAFADAVGRVERQQGAGIGDGRGIEHQGLAVEHDLAQGQAKTVLQQGLEQSGIGEQLGNAFTRGITAGQRDQRRVGQQDIARAVEGQDRVGHGGKQGVQLQVATLAGQDVDHGDGLHAAYAEQRFAQFFKHLRAQGRRVDIDIGRHHFHRIQVEIASAEQCQDFLGDSNAVDKADMDTHGRLGRSGCGVASTALARGIW